MRDQTHACARAQSDLVIEAWPLHPADLVGIVRAPREYLPEDPQRFARARRGRKRPEPLPLRRNHMAAFSAGGDHPRAAHEQHPREFLARDLKIEKALIVLLAHIERRRDRLDELGLANKRFKRGVFLFEINVGDLGDERLDAHVVRSLEVARHATAQIASLAHV